MKNAIAGLVTAFSMSALAAATPARAGSGDVAAGLIGGFAAGAIVGSALAPRPAPVYVAPAGLCGAGMLLDAWQTHVGRLSLGSAAHPSLRLSERRSQLPR
jgi:hypothetical protein